jgi:hypothetical protein
VRITGTANLVNTTGSGTLGFRLFIDTTSAGTMNASALAVNVLPASVTPAATTPITIGADLSGALKDLFTASALWIRIELIGSNAGATPVTGDMVLTGLQLRLVFQDKLF